MRVCRCCSNEARERSTVCRALLEAHRWADSSWRGLSWARFWRRYCREGAWARLVEAYKRNRLCLSKLEVTLKVTVRTQRRPPVVCDCWKAVEGGGPRNGAMELWRKGNGLIRSAIDWSKQAAGTCWAVARQGGEAVGACNIARLALRRGWALGSIVGSTRDAYHLRLCLERETALLHVWR